MWSGFSKGCFKASRKRRAAPAQDAEMTDIDAETLTGDSAAQQTQTQINFPINRGPGGSGGNSNTQTVEGPTQQMQPPTPAAPGAPRAGFRVPCPPGHIDPPTSTAAGTPGGEGSSTQPAGQRKERKGRGTNRPSVSTHDDPADRIVIRPSLTGSFVVDTPTKDISKSSDVSQEITTIMKGRFKARGPWPTYDMMLQNPPPGYDPDTDNDDTRFPAVGDGEASWLEFGRKFSWAPAHNDQIENIYQDKARKNFKNMLNHAKDKRPECPDWLAPGFARMCKYWDNDEGFKKKSEKNSQNRLKGPRMTHGHGSISGEDLRAKLKQASGGQDVSELEFMVVAKSGKDNIVDEEWRPLIEGIKEKTVEHHGENSQDWPRRPTKETFPPPNDRHRLPGHSNEAPELYGIQSHKKAYRPHGVNVTHIPPPTAQEVAAQTQNQFTQALIMKMLAGLPDFKENYAALYTQYFGHPPEVIPEVGDGAGPANPGPVEDNAANRFADQCLNAEGHDRNAVNTPDLARDDDE